MNRAERLAGLYRVHTFTCSGGSPAARPPRRRVSARASASALVSTWFATVGSEPSTRSCTSVRSPRATSAPYPSGTTSTATAAPERNRRSASSGATSRATVTSSREAVSASSSARDASVRSASATASGTRSRSKRHAVAEEEQHHDRHAEREVQRARVAPDVQRLLGRHRADAHERAPQACHHGASSRLPSRPTTARNTSSSDGSAGSTFTARAPPARSAAATAGPVQRAGSTRTCSPAPNGATPRTPGAAGERGGAADELLAARHEDAVGHPRPLERGRRVERDEPAVHHEADPAAVLRLVEVVRRHEDGRARRARDRG